MIDSLIQSLEVLEGDFEKVVEIPGDRGGVTQGGISSTAYPDLRDKISNGGLKRHEIVNIYKHDYVFQIAGHQRLMERAPWLLALLFFGRVHGAGDEQYTMLIQLELRSMDRDIKADGVWGPVTAAAVLGLSDAELTALQRNLYDMKEQLANQRVASVNIDDVSVGIRNRVYREFELADNIGLPTKLVINEPEAKPEFTRVSLGGIELEIRVV